MGWKKAITHYSKNHDRVVVAVDHRPVDKRESGCGKVDGHKNAHRIFYLMYERNQDGGQACTIAITQQEIA
jgi:hypothetical protein